MIRLHLRHRWEVVEQIGLVVVQQCETCDKTRIRILPARTPDQPNTGG